MAKVKVTITGTYELDPQFYPGCKTLEEMLEVDKNNPNVGIHELLDSLEDRDGNEIQVKFELVKDTVEIPEGNGLDFRTVE